MIFERTALEGAWLLHLELHEDERGAFARTFCVDEFARHGLDLAVVQMNLSRNRRRGTLRGLHFQAPPHAEAKLVACTAGALFDVIVDLRPRSPTFRQWLGVELDATRRTMLYVPEGLAHGFVTLIDNTEVLYVMSTRYVPEAARGVRWDDPELAIAWPLAPAVISPRDAGLPLLAELDEEALA